MRALPGAENDSALRKYAREICGLPLLSEMEYKNDQKGYHGQIIDPETEQFYSVIVRADADVLTVHAYEGAVAFGETYKWPASQKTHHLQRR